MFLFCLRSVNCERHTIRALDRIPVISMGLNNFLKKSRPIYALNAYVKARLTSAASAKIAAEYTAEAASRGVVYSEEAVPGIIRERLANRGISAVSRKKGALRVFWVGANKSQDYSGFIQGLSKHADVIPFINHKGGYGQEFSGPEFDAKIVSENSSQLLKQVKETIEAGKRIDLLMGQMWAKYLSPDALREIQQMGIVTINVSMDDRLPEMWKDHNGKNYGALGLASCTDLVLTSCPDCCLRYAVHDCPAIYWPMGSDPEIYKPAKIKDIDVCFVGGNYGVRGELIRKVMESGIKVEAYGGGWPNGHIGPDKMSDVFGRSKIILGVGTVAYNTDIFTLKLRDFDATMAGALYITHRNPDLLKIFSEGSEIECYLTYEEAISKIAFYLKQTDLREKISQAAAAKARAFHTWEIRFREIFSLLGLVE